MIAFVLRHYLFLANLCFQITVQFSEQLMFKDKNYIRAYFHAKIEVIVCTFNFISERLNNSNEGKLCMRLN